MSEIKTDSSIGFCGLLAILFIGLKLTGYISWSWWWVLSPLWIPFAIVGGLLLLFMIFMLILLLLATIFEGSWMEDLYDKITGWWK